MIQHLLLLSDMNNGRPVRGRTVLSAVYWVLIPEEAAPQFLDDAAPRNGMMPPPDSEMIAPP
jgi:hypothetical protein